MLKIENLSYSYGDFRALRNVELDVSPGEIVTIVGANGAGKSTVLKNISRLLKPNSSSIRFNGIDLSRCESHEVVELGIVQVPEGRRIFPEMTVLENLQMGSFSKQARKSRSSNMNMVFDLFPRLKERTHQLGGTMSGGEQQMLAIGRALMAKPKLLMMDEPSLGLSPLLVKTIFETIQTINKQGVAVLLVEQNVYQSLRIANRGYVLETGKIVLTGAGEKLLADEHVKKSFLGLAKNEPKNLS